MVCEKITACWNRIWGEDMKYIRYTSLIILLLTVLVWSCGCTRRNQPGNASTQTDSQTAGTTQDSTEGEKLLGVISDIEREQSIFSVSDVNSGWVYKVMYTPSTEFLSRFGEPLAADQLEIGELVDIVWDDTRTVANSIQVSYDAWEYEDVMGLSYDQRENNITIRGETFAYQNSLVLYDKTKELREDVFLSTEGQGAANAAAPLDALQQDAASGDAQETASADAFLTPGKRNSITLQEISGQDTVTCRGYRGKICSVVVNKGHGYVRLSNYSTYIGGTIAIGGVIEPVVKDMVLTVPVGNWTLEIDKDGKMGTKDIVVAQNEDQTVNLANLLIVATRRGVMQFNVTPEDCVITIDGKEYREQTRFVLEYGKHKVSVSAVDYKAYNGTITLQSAYMNVNVELTKLSEENEADVSTSTTQEAVTPASSSVSTVTTEALATEAATTQDETTLTTEAAN